MTARALVILGKSNQTGLLDQLCDRCPNRDHWVQTAGGRWATYTAERDIRQNERGSFEHLADPDVGGIELLASTRKEPDPARLAAIGKKYGLEIIGPPPGH